MSDATTAGGAAPASRYQTARFRNRLKRRHAVGTAMRLAGMVAILIATVTLAYLLWSVVSKGYTAFLQTNVKLEVTYAEDLVAPGDGPLEDRVGDGNYRAVIKQGLVRLLGEPEDRAAGRELTALISNGASYRMRDRLMENPDRVGATDTIWLPVASEIDMIVKGEIDTDDVKVENLNVSRRQLDWIAQMEAEDRLKQRFNVDFFTGGDSRDPQMAGIWAATKGSLMTLAVCIALAFPIAIAAAVYLEEFAPKNRWTELIEININNLAAVPSIIYGLLGLAVFLNFLGMPRGAPISGGVVLALMTLPIIIISARSALKSVPPQFREGARQMGASPQQVVMYGVLPVAMPGMLTGTIIGMAQALGETAPLLLMGMVAFVSTPPDGLADSSAVLPVQIFLWFGNPERGFVEKASAAIMVLLAFLIAMNGLAIYLRKRLERRW